MAQFSHENKNACSASSGQGAVLELRCKSHLIPSSVDKLGNEWQQPCYQTLVLLLVIHAPPSLLNAEI